MLFDIRRKERQLSRKNAAVFSYVWNQIWVGIEDQSEHVFVKQQINNFNTKVSQKWSACQRSMKIFISREFKWLAEDVTFSLSNESAEPAAGPSNVKYGRPQKEFQELASTSQKRKVLPLLEKYSQEELSFATQAGLRLDGQRGAANIVHEVSATTPKRATKIMAN